MTTTMHPYRYEMGANGAVFLRTNEREDCERAVKAALSKESGTCWITDFVTGETEIVEERRVQERRTVKLEVDADRRDSLGRRAADNSI